MSNSYRVTGGVAVLDHEPGSVFDHEFTAGAEADLIAAGRIQIEPRRYRVTGNSTVNEAAPGDTFEGVFTVGQEAALLAAGTIKRDDPPPAPARPAADKTTGKAAPQATPASPATAGNHKED